jgi:hypothetical protein
MHRTAVLACAIALGGCAPTRFYGDAKVDKGPAGCKAACDAWGMDLAGMVKMGEYSDGCICQVKPSAAPGPSGRVGASIPAATGVYLQMQAAAAAAAAQQQEMERQRTGSGPTRPDPTRPDPTGHR